MVYCNFWIINYAYNLNALVCLIACKYCMNVVRQGFSFLFPVYFYNLSL